MRRAGPIVMLLLLSAFLVLSCAEEDLSYELRIVNNSSLDIGRVGLGYTGIKAPVPDFEISVTVLSGETKTVELTLDSSSNYYTLFIWNDTDTKRIIWDGGALGHEYVLLSKGGSSTCTVENVDSTTVAGENNVTPYSYDW